MPNKQQSEVKCHLSKLSTVNLIPGQHFLKTMVIT